MNDNEKNGFSYTYSARDMEEIKRIRKKYVTEKENKMERLRRLDRGVTKKAQTVSLIFGIVGALLLGSGMSMCMTDIADVMGMAGWLAMLCGIIVGIFGGVLVFLAYPVYGMIIKRERKKIAPEIIRLTDELMK